MTKSLLVKDLLKNFKFFLTIIYDRFPNKNKNYKYKEKDHKKKKLAIIDCKNHLRLIFFWFSLLTNLFVPHNSSQFGIKQ